MRNTLIVLCSLALALCALVSPSATHASADGVLGATLGEAGPITRAGHYYWLESEGLATTLAPSPLAPEAGFSLLAGEAVQGRPSISLWRLDERGIEPLRTRLKANVRTERDYSNPTDNGVSLVGKSHEITLESGARGFLTSFALGQRNFAMVVTAPGGFAGDLDELRNDAMANLWPVVMPEPGLAAPLLLEGRFACKLVDYKRAGPRLHKRLVKGFISMRAFAISGKDYPTRDALQLDLEERLKRQGLRRSGGVTIAVNGAEAYCGEYFTGGSIERILYAKLGDDYLVALFHGSNDARETIKRDAEWFAASIVPTNIAIRNGEKPWRTVGEVTRMEVLAWQDGQTVFFGALFDKPWREEGVRYEARLVLAGKTIAEMSGTAASSLEFNPLPSARKLSLNGEPKGEAQFELRIGGLSETTRVSLR